MLITCLRGGRARRTARRLAPPAAVALAIAWPASPALAQQQQTLTVNAANDSVLATGLPYGPTTVQVKRPDALTGAPVVIGQFADVASGILPFSVNTTVPTAFDPDGDCWQHGSLTLPGEVGLTPDIRPGDTVTVTANLGLTVPADAESSGGPGGPIVGCEPLSPYGRNSVKTATGGSGTDIAASGTAQLLATGVSVTATDGHATTPPVDATLAADGTWAATIPADQVAALADGNVTIGAVYAVPDVSTGAAAHIAGAPLSIRKTTAPGGDGADDTPAAPAPAPGPAPAQPDAQSGPQPAAPAAPAPGPAAIGRLTSIRATSRISLARARRGGIRASFIVPTGAKVVRVRLSRRKSTAYLRVLAAAKPGTRQTVRIAGSGLARKLRRGKYTLTVTAGPSRSSSGPAITRAVVVR